MKKVKKLTLNKEIVSFLNGNEMNMVRGGDGTYNPVDNTKVDYPLTVPSTCMTCLSNTCGSTCPDTCGSTCPATCGSTCPATCSYGYTCNKSGILC
jgi:hypothetical protein